MHTDETDVSGTNCWYEFLLSREGAVRVIAAYVGFDLVGDENIFQPLRYYLEPLMAFEQRQKAAGVDIPFVFHAGETCGDGTHADENLYDAILLGTKRIGHGYHPIGYVRCRRFIYTHCRFSLVKHPKLMQICREKGIALEICPIS